MKWNEVYKSSICHEGEMSRAVLALACLPYILFLFVVFRSIVHVL